MKTAYLFSNLSGVLGLKNLETNIVPQTNYQNKERHIHVSLLYSLSRCVYLCNLIKSLLAINIEKLVRINLSFARKVTRVTSNLHGTSASCCRWSLVLKESSYHFSCRKWLIQFYPHKSTGLLCRPRWPWRCWRRGWSASWLHTSICKQRWTVLHQERRGQEATQSKAACGT